MVLQKKKVIFVPHEIVDTHRHLLFLELKKYDVIMIRLYNWCLSVFKIRCINNTTPKIIIDMPNRWNKNKIYVYIIKLWSC